jgi:glucokinase
LARKVAVGVDLGATRVRVCVGDESGILLWRRSTNMPNPPTVDGYVEVLVKRVREGIDHCPKGAEVTGVGVASIGPLDLKEGRMRAPANIPYDFVPIVRPLTEALGKKVTMINDAKAAALGERAFGAGRTHEDLVFITISTGIGAGAIVDGRILSGKDGNAGEIGHMVVDREGRLTCGCGRKGHWEAYCSGKNMHKLAALMGGIDPEKQGRKLSAELGVKGKVDSAKIMAAAKRRNPLALKVVAEMGKLNALGVANAINAYDPSIIILGGAVTLNNAKMVMDPIIEMAPKHAINRAPDIVLSPLGDDAGLFGALSLALRSQG